tara:strand:+ start:595 stop:807 length:213 start_codon:yes stop_codon:yes gene_type:complete
MISEVKIIRVKSPEISICMELENFSLYCSYTARIFTYASYFGMLVQLVEIKVYAFLYELLDAPNQPIPVS